MRRTRAWWDSLTTDERRELVRLERDGWYPWVKGGYERWMALIRKGNIGASIRAGLAYCPVCGDRGCGHVMARDYRLGGTRRQALARKIVV